MIYLVSTLIILLLNISSVPSLSCLDDSGNPVEWFIGYKFPDGFDYSFLTPGLDSWKNSSYNISKTGMLKHTFNAMYQLDGTSDSVYAMYNDEKSGEVTNTAWWGHMKGAFAFDSSESGIWLIHSIPKLSQKSRGYQYPFTGRIYGQHFFCVTLPRKSLLSIVDQLVISRPWIQDWYLSCELNNTYPVIFNLMHHKTKTVQKQAEVTLKSFNTQLKMRHFSKAISFGKDLYADLVSPSLKVGLDVETWLHGGQEPSVCDPPDLAVYNIKRLTFKHLNLNFSNYHDHAKWAVSIPPHSMQNSDYKWVCLGDINRQTSQFHRGGGTMCIQDDTVWNAFNSIVYEVEPCKLKRR